MAFSSPLVLTSCKRILHLCHFCDRKYLKRFKKIPSNSCISLSMTDWQSWTLLGSSLSSAVSHTSSPYSNIYSVVFPLSTIPYLLFLKGLWKKQTVPTIAKIGFSYLLVFVFFSIVGSILAQNLYQQTLSNVDWLHGCAEQFLSVTTFSILLGYRLFIDRINKP
ncbi:hypothetical protein GpartN1_g4731.t1 [Galdieria partita]|uniref:Uncharacterized protein n=1 Tax=Galdieria partita TaxID=83374 RepID=A0A9C7URR2_9RHOD|nr:hypothetical protein GpartN1_g4123.t1 [Galdieria partita]GJQ12940.1 hypothetical protein GpartN1_g4731.t1 [Galdieria partita]